MSAGPEPVDEPSDALVGLDDESRAAAAGDFFDAFPWDKPSMDPAAMTARAFLDALS